MQSMLYAIAGGVPALLVTFGVAALLRIPEASFLNGIVARFIPARAR